MHAWSVKFQILLEDIYFSIGVKIAQIIQEPWEFYNSIGKKLSKNYFLSLFVELFAISRWVDTIPLQVALNWTLTFRQRIYYLRIYHLNFSQKKICEWLEFKILLTMTLITWKSNWHVSLKPEKVNAKLICNVFSMYFNCTLGWYNKRTSSIFL